jgi:hypothetical protein
MYAYKASKKLSSLMGEMECFWEAVHGLPKTLQAVVFGAGRPTSSMALRSGGSVRKVYSLADQGISASELF